MQGSICGLCLVDFSHCFHVYFLCKIDSSLKKVNLNHALNWGVACVAKAQQAGMYITDMFIYGSIVFRLCFELPLFLLHPVVVKYQLLLLAAEHILQLIL